MTVNALVFVLSGHRLQIQNNRYPYLRLHRNHTLLIMNSQIVPQQSLCFVSLMVPCILTGWFCKRQQQGNCLWTVPCFDKVSPLWCLKTPAPTTSTTDVLTPPGKQESAPTQSASRVLWSAKVLWMARKMPILFSILSGVWKIGLTNSHTLDPDFPHFALYDNG